MTETKIAKLFKNGASQAVRLPVEFRFDGDKVYISRNEVTGDVILSSCPGSNTWSDFFEFTRSIDVPADFMAERPMNIASQERNLFSEKDR